MAQVLKAHFITSAPTLEAAPPEGVSEVAFLGRSNVGKSSLLNALTGRKALAKTSSTPGKTRLINFFDITLKGQGEPLSLRLVDLPGFGYAKVSKVEQAQWQKALADFLRVRRSIRVFVRLIDARHPELPQDQMMRDFVASLIRPDQLDLPVFTKVDKLNRKERDALKRRYPEAVLLSSVSKEGIEALLDRLMVQIFQEGA